MLLTAIGLMTPAYASADRPPIWTGVYFGINGGYASGEIKNVDWVNGFGVVSDAVDFDGWIGGLHVGASRQFSSLVIGVEISGMGGKISGSKGECFSPPFAGTTCEVDGKWLGLALARLGYAHGSWQVYGTAGLALAGFGQNRQVQFPQPSNVVANGFAYGAGVEFAYHRGLSVGLEYLRADLTADGEAPLIGNTSVVRDYGLNIVRGRLSIHLN